MFAGINFCLALFTWLYLPETRKVKLEEIDTLFGGANHVEKGANLLDVASRQVSIAHQGGQHGDTIGEVREPGHQYGDKTATSQVENVTKY